MIETGRSGGTILFLKWK